MGDKKIRRFDDKSYSCFDNNCFDNNNPLTATNTYSETQRDTAPSDIHSANQNNENQRGGFASLNDSLVESNVPEVIID